MGKWVRFIVAAAAPLMLTACLWSPGKFTSELTLRKNGTYTLDYKGEILFQLPEGKPQASEPWSSKMARCYVDDRRDYNADTAEHADAMIGRETQSDKVEDKARPCTAAELAKLKADYDKEAAGKVAEKRQESEQMAKMFGLPGSDEASNRKFAATLMKYKGWRSVAYQRKGVFLVDYRADGSLAQDVVFPMIPDSDLMLPFVAMRRRADGSVLVTAPAFTGGSGFFGARAKMMGMPDTEKDAPKSRATGRFTIVTDAEILTNNSEEGPAPHAGGRHLKWAVDATSTKVPEALVKL